MKLVAQYSKSYHSWFIYIEEGTFMTPISTKKAKTEEEAWKLYNLNLENNKLNIENYE